MHFEPKKKGTKFFHRLHIKLSPVALAVGVFSLFRFTIEIWARKKKMKSQKFKSVSMPLFPTVYELLCLEMRSFENYIIIFSTKIFNLILYKLGYYSLTHFEEKRKKNFPQ